jgi:hypothetical protein
VAALFNFGLNLLSVTLSIRCLREMVDRSRAKGQGRLG